MASYVETWKTIAVAVGRSERWCRYMAQRTQDPLPVFKVGGIVRIHTSDIESWLCRQQDQPAIQPIRERHEARPHLKLIA